MVLYSGNFLVSFFSCVSVSSCLLNQTDTFLLFISVNSDQMQL